MPELVVFQKDQKIFHLPLDATNISIGRSSTNDLILTGDLVSRRHAVVENEGGQFWLKDYSSTGTTCDGRPVTGRVLLKDNSEIGISDWRLLLCADPQGRDDEKEKRQTQITQLRAGLNPDRTRILHFEPSGLFKIIRPSLFVSDGVSGQRQIRIKKSRIVIGTSPECDVVLQDEFVSKLHVELRQSDQGFYLQDLNSTNGTLVRGAKVKECYIKENEEIQVGQSRLIIHFEKESDNELKPSEQSEFCGLVGESKVMRVLFKKIEKVAETDMTTLIQGETGTGKELVARAIHDLSERRDKPFVVLNCGAISANLIENELFGHEKGAYTGADVKQIGAFEQAHLGTLFLDEIGELPVALQSKVLRVLEYQSLRRLGGQGEIKVDVRIIAATHRNLKGMVAREKFREDLFYRLYVLPLDIPPLRARLDDVRVITEKFMQSYSSRKVVRIEDKAMQKLVQHVWPGNVRELKNTIMRAIAYCDGVSIKPEDIDVIRVTFAGYPSADPISGDTADDEQRKVLNLRDKNEFERERINNALNSCGGDRNSAARALGMGRSTLFRKIKELGLE